MTHPAIIEPLLFRGGDRMSLEEFLERWDRMPGLKFAELIEGVVYLASPVSLSHGRSDNSIQTLIGLYTFRTPGTAACANSAWLMTSSSAPQPDCAIEILPAFGGRTSVRKGLAAGAPEFVAEICHSSRSYDLGPN